VGGETTSRDEREKETKKKSGTQRCPNRKTKQEERKKGSNREVDIKRAPPAPLLPVNED